jgi:inner membrane transporter RhtA
VEREVSGAPNTSADPRNLAFPAALVALAAVIQELGAALAVGLFVALGPVGTTCARFLIAGVILCVAVRPRVRSFSREAWKATLALAAGLSIMNLAFYNAIAHIPLGIAVTIEVLGPLTVSVVLGGRRVAWLWALLAFVGVALIGIGSGGLGVKDIRGFLFAAVAAAAWACYILASSRVAAVLPRLDGLAVATLIGAAVTIPLAAFTVAADTTSWNWRILGVAVAVALMSSVIPYSLELVSLRSLPPSTFAIVTCLSPVIAALAGWIILGQQLTGWHYAAIGLVSVASVGAVRTALPGKAPYPPPLDHA